MTEELTARQHIFRTLAEQFTTEELVSFLPSALAYNADTDALTSDALGGDALKGALFRQSQSSEFLNNPDARLALFDEFQNVFFSVHSPEAIADAIASNADARNIVTSVYDKAAQYGAVEMMVALDNHPELSDVLNESVTTPNQFSHYSRTMFVAMVNEQYGAMAQLIISGKIDEAELRARDDFALGGVGDLGDDGFVQIPNNQINTLLDEALAQREAVTPALQATTAEAIALEADMKAVTLGGVAIDGMITEDELEAFKDALCIDKEPSQLTLSDVRSGLESLANQETPEHCQQHQP